jgi:hypothetical protein
MPAVVGEHDIEDALALRGELRDGGVPVCHRQSAIRTVSERPETRSALPWPWVASGAPAASPIRRSVAVVSLALRRSDLGDTGRAAQPGSDEERDGELSRVGRWIGRGPLTGPTLACDSCPGISPFVPPTRTARRAARTGG